jgi:hypothetical protein
MDAKEDYSVTDTQTTRTVTGPINLKPKANPKKNENIFILCDSCFWCATYLVKNFLPMENGCPSCLETQLSSFPIMPNESFTFNYTETHGVELEFGFRTKKKN